MTEKTGGGLTFWGALLITFIVLKLTKVITWTWWWVMVPLWGPFLILAIFVILYLIIKK